MNSNVRHHISNDQFFDPHEQLRTLSEEAALEYARAFVDQNCEELDAAFLKQVMEAGDRSIELTHQHAIAGSPAAQLVYGTLLLHGSQVPPSPAEGIFWLVRASNGGSRKAALVLANAFLEGRQVKRNAARALVYATVATDAGPPEAEYFLANLLIGVDDIPQDHLRAVSLLQSAAQRGYLPAIIQLNENSLPLSPASDA